MIEYKTKYAKQYKKLDSSVKRLIERALTDMLDSDNPQELGEFKRYSNTYTYRLNKSNRLMYKVYPNRIVLLAVGGPQGRLRFGLIGAYATEELELVTTVSPLEILMDCKECPVSV